MNSFYFFQGMGFFRLQSKLVYPPSLPPRLSEKSRRELKSLYPTTGETTNFQSSQRGLLLLRQSPPKKHDSSGRWFRRHSTTLMQSPTQKTRSPGDDFADIAPHRCNHQPKKHDSLRGVEGNALTHNIIKRQPPRRSKGEEALVIHWISPTYPPRQHYE